ncbi:MAG: galactose mutarotase [Deltaproteobacteria bacterium]|nr:galactose mutarotase [Deltaproteobacteria bacterium]
MAKISDDVKVYTLKHPSGLRAQVSNLGGIVMSLLAPDRHGHFGNVVLGYDRIEHYAENPCYLGAICGRYANRIANGTFTLEGRRFRLATHNHGHHLHGGNRGFDRIVWLVQKRLSDTKISFTYRSADGEEGYPGQLTTMVSYTLTDDCGLQIDYEARTTATTIVNLTSHCYFNLAADLIACPQILDHELKIYADKFTPVDATMIPTGDIQEVRGTPLDFREFKPIGRNIDDNYPQLTMGSGYDHNYVIQGEYGVFRLAAEVIDPHSGRKMQMWTTEPGLQFYSGNFLDDASFGKHSGFCLEAQRFPDSPNKPQFPSTVLMPDQVYRQSTLYRFSI